MFVLPAYVAVHHIHALPLEVRRKCQNPLELELGKIVTCQVGAGKLGILWKSSQCSYLLSRLFSPSVILKTEKFTYARDLT